MFVNSIYKKQYLNTSLTMDLDNLPTQWKKNENQISDIVNPFGDEYGWIITPQHMQL